ncbi:hypothetical protein FRC11_011056, partial [Ceratobasidium sp. 423]
YVILTNGSTPGAPVAPVAPESFGSSASFPDAQQWENEQIIAQALPNAFHCFDILQPRSRQYEHLILQRAIAVALFYSLDAIGAVYHMYFDPMSLPT